MGSKNKAKRKGAASKSIATNRKARYDYQLGDTVSAGLSLQGWEVKSLRSNRAQLRESYVSFKNGEAWLVGCHITPLSCVSTHITPAPTRDRKLLLHRREIDHLRIAVERQGFTVIPTRLYWSNNRAKLEIATAKGKKHHDKRASERDRDWNRQQERILKSH